jgi:hypothetical protein
MLWKVTHSLQVLDAFMNILCKFNVNWSKSCMQWIKIYLVRTLSLYVKGVVVCSSELYLHLSQTLCFLAFLPSYDRLKL